jgi:serine/threonine-protein kinase RsbW
MLIDLALSLPRDQRSVPVTRHAIRAILLALGVEQACTSDIEVALSEACTNVLRHAAPAAQYEVRLRLSDQRCVLQVVEVDRGGAGERPAILPAAETPPGDAERGRGLLLMRALVDRVGFRTLPDAGPVVSLEKQLVYDRAGQPEQRPGTSA